MGNPASKIEGEIPHDECSEGSVPSTPILTPKINRNDKVLDPRSPSSNIIRTPLEFLSLQKNPQMGTELGVELIEDQNTTPTTYTVLETDPRSPTTEFVRTPIVVSAAEARSQIKPHNKHLDNVRNQEVVVRTPAPKLIESSPISAKTDATKRKSLIGLLETNIDFTETDLDVVIQEKSLQESLTSEKESETTETPNNINVSLKDEPEAATKSNAEVQTDDANIIILPPDLCQNSYEKPPLNNVEIVKDFNKKLNNLIYEDDSGEEHPKCVVVKDGSRTPLAVCNSNHQPKKTNKLRVSDKPKKSTNISRIPVFKDKLDNKTNQPCENTPPRRSLPKRITEGGRQPRWDHDATLII